MWSLPPAGILLLAALIAAPVAAQETPDGRAVYREACKSCHGVSGVPPARAVSKYPKVKVLGDSGFVSALSADSIVTILQKGLSKDMKSFADKLSVPEMEAVAGYVKELAESRSKRRP